MAIEVMNFITNYPRDSLILLSVLVTLVSTLITKWLTNQEHLKQLKERQKLLQKDLKNHKPGEKRWEEIQSEMLQITGTMMKSSFKPMFVTIIPFLILLNWIKDTWGPILSGWIWYYILASIVASIIYRKLFKMA